MLAQMGFNVLGVDISETAIEMANQFAKDQELEMTFQVADILELSKIQQKFDLVYDSHCLHCIVFETDRENVLKGVKDSLNKKGIFILDTMVMPAMGHNPAQSYSTLRFDENYILWHKTKPSNVRGVVHHEGEYWCAQRRIYPLKKVLSEVEKTGFKIVSQQLDEQENEPSMLRLVLEF